MYCALLFIIDSLQESVPSRVAYERKGAKWKELTDTVTYFIAKESLPINTYGCELLHLSLKALMNFAAYYWEKLASQLLQL